ncbi:NAD binding Rossmann fold oxidoreductase [Mrakia frigida]|uniref:NAD binding Rossmann fold oxidoreductase n=1 Tax=Mrakia frigida TaxID=29902 RepID=UPI003FCBF7EB
MSPSPVRVSVIGVGMSALVFHIPFILSLPKLYTLHSILERKATPEKSDARDFFPGVKVVTNLKDVLEDAEVDLVVVSGPNGVHFEHAKAALEAGKNVVVEKPITPTFEEAQILVALAKKTGLVLATYQSRRFDSDFLTTKALIEEGAFGELSEFESHYDRYKNELATARLWKEAPEVGIGAEFDLGSHLLDQALTLFGRPQTITAVIRNSRAIGHPDVSDSFHIQLGYPATEAAGRRLPLIATVQGSILSLVAPQLRFSIKGTNAAFVKHGLDVQEDQLIASGFWKGPPQDGAVKPDDTTGVWGTEPESIWGTLYTLDGKQKKVPSKTGAYKAWFENVAEAVQTKNPSLLLVKPEQAALVIEVIEAAIKSSKEGKRVNF